MLIKEFDPDQTPAYPIQPGDSLYFLRDQDDCAIRVKATVLRVLFFTNLTEEESSQTLKEMQPRLKLTEDQYRYWFLKEQFMLVEFGAAHKIVAIQVAPEKVADRSGWIAFEDFHRISEKEVL